MLLSSTLRIPISLQENKVSLEPSLKQSILPSANKTVSSFLIILLATNQSGANFSAGLKLSNAWG